MKWNDKHGVKKSECGEYWYCAEKESGGYSLVSNRYGRIGRFSTERQVHEAAEIHQAMMDGMQDVFARIVRKIGGSAAY